MKKAIKILFVMITLAIALISSYKIFTTLYAYRQADNVYGDLREIKQTSENNTNSGIDLSDIN